MKNGPRFKKSSCPYCGNAPISHFMSFVDGSISFLLDPVVAVIPTPLTNFAETIPSIIFRILSFFKIIKFSKNSSGACSFRSRVIWEEAKQRNIYMEQARFWKWLLEFYRAKINGKYFYFQSLPIPPHLLNKNYLFDDKIFLKHELNKIRIPTPNVVKISFFSRINPEKLFNTLGKSLVVKPSVGSRGRHTTVNIKTPEALLKAILLGRKITPCLAVEEYLEGDVYRATVINGVLSGFYHANSPFIVGNGQKTILELIEEKNTSRNERIEFIIISKEIKEYIARAGFALNDILPNKLKLNLTHRTGRSHGGTTREMIEELHPSFIPIIEHAANALKLVVVGFDCIIPDPVKNAHSQHWGIIESNSLPFIDLHYFALEGTPRNIAGMIWDLWKK